MEPTPKMFVIVTCLIWSIYGLVLLYRAAVKPLFKVHEHLPGIYWAKIEYLRQEEGNAVTIICDNPEGDPNHAIDCWGDWTDWEERRFSGATMFECLNNAVLAKKAREPIDIMARVKPKMQGVELIRIYNKLSPEDKDYVMQFMLAGFDMTAYGFTKPPLDCHKAQWALSVFKDALAKKTTVNL